MRAAAAAVAWAALVAVLALATAAATAAATAVPVGRDVPVRLTPGWRAVDAAVAPGELHCFHVHLKQRNLDKLEAMFWAVSDPKDAQYGKHLSAEELDALVAPSVQDATRVEHWLKRAGYKASGLKWTRARDSVSVCGTVAQTEELFGVRLARYQHDNGRTVLRSSTRRAAVPRQLADIVELVYGVSEQPLVPRKRAMAMSGLRDLRAPSAASSASSAPSSSPRMESLRAAHGTRAKKTVSDALTPMTATNLMPRGNDGSVTVRFNVVCSDGTLATTTPPCSSTSSPLTTGTLTGESYHGDQYNPNHTTQSVTCATPTPGQPVQCSLTMPVTNYEPVVELSIQLGFLSGLGPVVTNPYMVIASPDVTPRTLQQLYSIPSFTAVRNANVTQSVAEFEQQYYDDADLRFFFKEMGVTNNAPVTVIGPNDESNPGVEALLDIQYIMGLAPGSPTTFWSIAANSTEEVDDILTWAIQVGNVAVPPMVHSISYGMTEENVDKYLGQGYLARSDVEFQKLAVRGITIIIACGDTGSYDLGGPPMGTNDCTRTHPDWPSQSPYITAVGSTYITPWADPICYLPLSQGGMDCADQPLGEVSVSVDAGMRWTTGGGFSNFQTRPSYQDAAVSTYLNTAAMPPTNMFNAKGRAYPDVATVGHNLLVAVNEEFMPVDGTSASAPIFAAVVTLLNDERLQVGKSPLGFLNSFLYGTAQMAPNAFADVVVGNNGCGAYGSAPVCCQFGYEAVRGWDAVSGLGSPNYLVLRDVVRRLP